MFDYLSAHDGPVVDGLEKYETVFAKNQPEYVPLRTLPGEYGNSAISRFRLTDEQRKAVSEGADIYLEILHFKGPLAPSRLMVMNQTSRTDTLFKEWWRGQTKGSYPVEGSYLVENSTSPATAASDRNAIVNDFLSRLHGFTFTQEEADSIKSYIQGAVHGGMTSPAQPCQQQSAQKSSIDK